MRKKYSEMTQEEKAVFLLNKLANAIGEIFELIGLERDERRAMLYAKTILKKNINIDLEKMTDYVVEHYSGFNYPPVTLFLKGIGHKTKEDLAEEISARAWQYASGWIDTMANNFGFGVYSKDRCLVYAINKIGVNVIRSSIKAGMPNYIDSYTLNKFEKQFKQYYKEAFLNKELQNNNLIGSQHWADKHGRSWANGNYIEEYKEILLPAKKEEIKGLKEGK